MLQMCIISSFCESYYFFALFYFPPRTETTAEKRNKQLVTFICWAYYGDENEHYCD